MTGHAWQRRDSAEGRPTRRRHPPRKVSSMPSTASVSVQALDLTTFRGLPAYILIVHAVVIFVPLSAIALIAALTPSWAQRMGIVLPGRASVSHGPGS
jgi:hypothetical protein